MNNNLEDLIERLTFTEKQQLVDDLYDEGYYQTELEKRLNIHTPYTLSVNEQFFYKELSKIESNYLNLTPEEEVLILKIAKRF